MAKIIGDGSEKRTSVRAGRVYLVENVDKPMFSRAKDQYFAVWVEDHDGKDERPLLITEREMDRIETRSLNNPEDKFTLSEKNDPAFKLEESKVVKGRFIPVYNQFKQCWFENDYYYGVVIQDMHGVTIGCYLFTQAEITKMEKRAEKNPNTVPEKGWLVDLFD